MSLADRTSVDRLEVGYYGHVSAFDTRLVTLSVRTAAVATHVVPAKRSCESRTRFGFA